MCELIYYKDYDFKHYIYAKLEVLKRGNNGSLLKQQRRNIHLVSAFDIETTRLRFSPEGKLITERKYNRLSKKNAKLCSTQSIMYIWQWQVDEFVTIYGRTWAEFLEFIDTLKSILGCYKRAIVYVHNLSYEFQFLRGIYDFSDKEVFATDSRRILKCSMFNDAIEFRCSYAHSNMSLDTFCKKMKVLHGKLKGSLDYNKRRFTWTPLTKEELSYCQNDVLGLVEAIKAELKLDGDNLQSIPLTSTGYVRRDFKKVMRKYKSLVQEIFPSVELYRLLRAGFRGGDTHANRYYAGYKLTNVKSKDISSSYPAVLVTCKFPMSKFFKVECEMTENDLRHLIFRRQKAVIVKLRFNNIRQKDKFCGYPYLSISKCCDVKNAIEDNGRVLSCDTLTTTITDVDFKIIDAEYDYDSIEILECQHAKYGYLPREFRDLVLEYYTKKTELKDLKGLEVLYNKFKNKINAIYGMTAQDPLIESLLYSDFEFKIDETVTAEDILNKSRKNAFIVYQWGVWTTAHARSRLHDALRILGDYFVYCDTDSVKYIEDYDGQFDEAFKSLNAKLCDLAIEAGGYADDKHGKTHFIGVYEDEPTYRYFKTLGAKKYIFSYNDSEIHATIAGVSKTLAGSELSKYQGFDSFDEGFEFRDAGGNDIVYNDIRTPITLKIRCRESEMKTRSITIISNAAVVPSTYTVSLKDDYAKLLQDSHNLLTTLSSYDKIKLS